MLIVCKVGGGKFGLLNQVPRGFLGVLMIAAGEDRYRAFVLF